jgi:hypothetical protein
MNPLIFLLAILGCKLVAIIAAGVFGMLALIAIIAKSQGCKPSRLKLHLNQGQPCITDLDALKK